MDKKELEKLYKDFTLQLVLSKNLDDIGLIAITKNQLKQIIKIITHYNQIQTQVKKQKKIIDKAEKILNECKLLMTHEFDWEEQVDNALDILKEVSE